MPSADPDARTGPPLPGLRGVVDAYRFLTRDCSEVGAWAVYLPLVGVALGALWLVADRLAGAAGGRVGASVAVVLVAAAATAGRPLRALGRTLIALAYSGPRRLAILERGNGSASEIVGPVLIALAEIGVLCLIERFRIVGLAFAPVLGCCSMVVMAVGSRAARADGRRLKFAPSVTFREFGLASTATFAVVFLSTEFLGLLLVLATAAFTIGARVFFHRWIDGVNDTALLATGEATQLMVLALLAVLS